MKDRIKKIAALIALMGIGVGGGIAGTCIFSVKTDENGKATVKVEMAGNIELATKMEPTKIETADGDIEIIEAPTVEEVDTGNVTECPEGQECGKGRYIYAPVDTPYDFKNYTDNKCWNTDDWAGAQCWDLGDLFWQNYAGRNLDTCGTGAAKGAWNCKEKNAGDDFELITDPHKLQVGDWLIFNNGKYGHVGMALGSYNNGYIALFGQNQGGHSCEGGGAAANTINISLKSFVGAFRPKSYIKPDPTPTPTPTPVANCDSIDVKKGDTLGKIMLRCEGKIDWSKMNDYAKSWRSIKVKKFDTVYDGWVSADGVGLFAGDKIERIK